jgi:hypothetical protein
VRSQSRPGSQTPRACRCSSPLRGGLGPASGQCTRGRAQGSACTQPPEGTRLVLHMLRYPVCAPRTWRMNSATEMGPRIMICTPAARVGGCQVTNCPNITLTEARMQRHAPWCATNPPTPCVVSVVQQLGTASAVCRHWLPRARTGWHRLPCSLCQTVGCCHHRPLHPRWARCCCTSSTSQLLHGA